jgi:D-sedoheptulose 7-phosphate isomerase
MSVISSYFSNLHDCASGAHASDARHQALTLQDAIEKSIALVKKATADGGKIMFVGNGGSAGIASHLAIDFTKNGNFPALAFNDGAALTCLGNDLGFERVFSRQIEAHGRPGDVLFAISSSGRSADILQAATSARSRDCAVVTLSAFTADNPLRRLGDVNFYVSNGEYGFVEIAHLAICHAVLDIAMGWQASGSAPVRTASQ